MRVIEGGKGNARRDDQGELLVRALRTRMAILPQRMAQEIGVQLEEPNLDRMVMLAQNSKVAQQVFEIAALLRGLEAGHDMADFQPLIERYARGA